MIYVEHRPAPALASCIRMLWYCRAPGLPHARERVLPTGQMQIILNLAGETLTECSSGYSMEVPATARPLAAAIVAGPRRTYELVDTRDLAELVGVLFHPGGAAPFLRESASAFFEQSIALDDIVPFTNLRCRLHTLKSPPRKLLALEDWLLGRIAGRQPLGRRHEVVAALDLLGRRSVRETACSLSMSERRLHGMFQSEVGLSPKLWSRIHRFQHALHHLHTGAEPRWEQLALACGFYDQAHFCNEFHAFSGINPSAYACAQLLWKNHVPEPQRIS